MGSGRPQTLAAMRGMKAEGGWGVVCTEYCSIHPSACDHPYPQCRLWDDADIRDQALMAEAVHEHRSEEHTSELQSLMRISYAVFCLKKKKKYNTKKLPTNHTLY